MSRRTPHDPISADIPDPVFKVPSYRLHKTWGLAVVTVRGRDVYLGPYGSDESRAAYDRVIRELTVSRGVDPTQRDRLTVAEFVLIYWRHAQTYYPPGTLNSTIKPALRRLRRNFGETLVKDFGPLRLKALRLSLLEERDDKGRRLSRRYINDSVAQVRAFFKWGAARARRGVADGVLRRRGHDIHDRLDQLPRREVLPRALEARRPGRG